MPQLMRYSRQKYQEGTDGIMANPLPRRRSSTGQVFNVNTGTDEADRNKLYDINGNFVASDVGRMVRIDRKSVV